MPRKSAVYCSRLLLLVPIVLMGCFPILAAESNLPPETEQARAILDASGVQGGLVVHVGCGDGKLTAALRANERFVVFGLDKDERNVDAAREYITNLGLAGKVSVDRWSGERLPLIDGLARLIVVGHGDDVDTAELMRVLAPGGVACVQQNGRWNTTVKPWPDDTDQWTHYLHDASGNAVADDARIGPPRHMQWRAGPVWMRNHHTLASISTVVSAGGRLFYIVDDETAATLKVPPRWSVVARDAFSGVLLWERTIPVWAHHLRGFRSGPVQLQRMLVAAKDRVYLPLGIDAPLSALDAATGELIETYEATDATEEIILHNGTLMVVAGSPISEQASVDPARRGEAKHPNVKSIVAIQAETGKTLWKWTEPQPGRLVPVTLAAEGNQAFVALGKDVVCLDCRLGKPLWRWSGTTPKAAPAGKKPKKTAQRGAGWSVATLVVQQGIVLWADGSQVTALTATEGKRLWTCPGKPGFRSPVDVFVIGGLVWIGPAFTEGRDLKTGEVKRTSTAAADIWTVGHHHRCYREKATQQYILTGKRGIEFLDLDGDDHTRNNWIRGLCQYGIMPANGLIYAPSHACGCFMEAKLFGFWALAAERTSSIEATPAAGPLLEQGAAYSAESSTIGSGSDAWPTYRRDPQRSGSTDATVPSQLAEIWQTNLGGRLSAPVVADGTVLVSSIDAHRVEAIDANSGKPRWTFTTGGRVDSPPTIYRGLVLFGCADGWVYCLRLSDGQQVWRLHAAGNDLRTVSLDQVESLWPVHGSVLVQDGVAYFTAGRSSYLDGGMCLYGVDPTTGKALHRSAIRSVHPTPADGLAQKDRADFNQKIVQNLTDYKTFAAPDRSDGFSMDGAISDVLVGDGDSIYLRQMRFDAKCRRQTTGPQHLFSTSRLTDDAEVHRSHWILGTGDFSRLPVAYSWIAFNPDRHGSAFAVPYGLMLSFTEETIWGVRRGKADGYTLFAEKRQPVSTSEQPLPDVRKTGERPKSTRLWSTDLSMRPRAMVKAGNALVLGGMHITAEPEKLSALYAGRTGGLLRIVSADDGTRLSERKLPAPPVWDGIAVTNNRLYIATADGRVLCLGKKGTQLFLSPGT